MSVRSVAVRLIPREFQALQASEEEPMRFLCLGYSDEKNWVAIPKSDLEAILAYVDALRREGHHWENGQALQSTRTAKTLRWQGGKVVVTDGPYAETKEQLGGFAVFEADD